MEPGPSKGPGFFLCPPSEPSRAALGNRPYPFTIRTVRYIVIHGHFYQPPRENPWTERVGREVSAAPFHNWNARIQRECYAPNRAARILDSEKKITSISNNYEWISFNFGPTLLDWMVRRDPATLESLVEADRLSRRRLGHGNAIAQAYNHSILPLLDRRDKRTQVRWGKTHFRRLYGREPEGMWLPETAADLETLDVLAEEKIRFTILAPWQLTGVKGDGERTWRGEIRAEDLGRAYRCATGSGREISLFFYDGGIAQQVAFGDLLGSGDAFSARLETAALERPDHAPLVTVATDGETYGHHHRFGEMALCYALQRVSERRNTEVTNYAAFLERFPPTMEARILEPGSWSCIHGVERWRADCGCRTGGDPSWNQAWRTPLFDALSLLREELAGVFEKEASKHLRDPWAARDDYIDVLLDPGPESKAAFMDRHGRPNTDSAGAWRFLEMERHALLMFTSCGWFFNDLAGIETLQVLRYAGRALELCGTAAPRDLEERFLAVLAGAVTNQLPTRAGDVLFRQVVRDSHVDPASVAAEGVLAKRLGLTEGEPAAAQAYCVDVVPARKGEVGRVEVVHKRTGDVDAFDYRVDMDETPHLAVVLDRTSTPPPWRRAPEDEAEQGTQRVIGPEELDPEAAEQLSHRFLKRLESGTVLQLKSLLKSREPVIRFLEARGIRPPRALGLLLEAVWLEELLEDIEAPPGSENGRVASWHERLARFETLSLARDDRKLSLALARRLERDTERLCREHGEGTARNLLEVLKVAESLEPRPDLWEAQNFFYQCAMGEGPGGLDIRTSASVPAALRREVASRLGFSPRLVNPGEKGDKNG